MQPLFPPTWGLGTDNGERDMKINLLLKGPRSTAIDTKVDFDIPVYIHTLSDPTLSAGLGYIVSKNSFSVDGCPVLLPVAMIVKLKKIDSLENEEQARIVSSVDVSHSHTLIIRKTVEKKPIAPEPDKPDTAARKKNSFNYGCHKYYFLVTIKPDTLKNSRGGIIEVLQGKDKIPQRYAYNNYDLQLFPFVLWLSTVYKDLKIGECIDCSDCFFHLTEEIIKNMSAIAAEKSLADAPAAKTEEKPVAKDSATKEKTASAAMQAPLADTFKYGIKYIDTFYNLTVVKFKDRTVVKLCPTTGACQADSAALFDKAVFKEMLTGMLKKATKADGVDASKISPSPDDLFSKYQSDYQEKNPPKKTSAETLGMAAADSLAINDKFSQVKVGRISIKDSSISIFSYSGKELKKVKIDSVTCMIEDGKIVRRTLMIYTSAGIFWNGNSPIPVRWINMRKHDRLDFLDIPDSCFVYFGDVLKYDDYGNYIPDDLDRLVLTRSKMWADLNAVNNLNSLINFSLFTDLAGLVGRKPNGLLNTDVTGRFITNTCNIFNADFVPFSFIEANLLLSKFDSKFKSIDSAALGKTKDTVDRMLLMQNAWLKGTLKANVLSLRTFGAQYLNLNIGARINVVNADSLIRTTANSDIIFFDYFFEMAYKINRVKNFGMEASIKCIWQRLADKEPFSNRGSQTVFNPQVLFSYYPGSDPAKQFYIKFNYYAGQQKTAQNFYQLQFGWKTGLKLKQ